MCHTLAVTRRQQAKALELWAAMSLSRLWQHQASAIRRSRTAGTDLCWFTEGFDTADLQDAKALLYELA